MSAFIINIQQYKNLERRLEELSVRYDNNWGFPSDLYHHAPGIAFSYYVANVDSVNYRYNEKIEVVPFGDFMKMEHQCKAPFSLIKLRHFLQCVDYQSCEVPNWSERHPGQQLQTLIHTLSDIIISKIPETKKIEESTSWEVLDPNISPNKKVFDQELDSKENPFLTN